MAPHETKTDAIAGKLMGVSEASVRRAGRPSHQESIDALERKSSRLSRQLIYLNWIGIALTVALVAIAVVTYAKS